MNIFRNTIITLFFIFINNITTIAQYGLYLQNNSNLIATNNSNIIVDGGNITNNGNCKFSDNSNVIFTGNNNQYIKGTSVISFGNLYVKNNNKNVILNNNIEVRSNVYFVSGNIDVKDYICDLTTTGNVNNENENTRFRATNTLGADGGGYGYIKAIRNNPSGNTAGLGLNFTPTSALGNNTEIRRYFYPQQGTGSYTTNYSILRTYVIIPTNPVYTITVNRFRYFGGTNNYELNGHNELQLQLFQYVKVGGVEYWTPREQNVDIVNDFCSGTTVNPNELNYIKITLASIGMPLPVKTIKVIPTCYKRIVTIYVQLVNVFDTEKLYVDKFVNNNWCLFYEIDVEQYVEMYIKDSLSSDELNIVYYRLRNDKNEDIYYFYQYCSINDVINVNVYENNNSIYVDYSGIPSDITKFYIVMFDNVGKIIRRVIIDNNNSERGIYVIHDNIASGLYYFIVTDYNRFFKLIKFNIYNK